MSVITEGDILRLKRIAHGRWGNDITPVPGSDTLDGCVTAIGDRIAFWFNTPDHSTHLVCVRQPLIEVLKKRFFEKITDAAGNQWYFDRNGRYIMCRRHDDRRNRILTVLELIKRSIRV